LTDILSFAGPGGTRLLLALLSPLTLALLAGLLALLLLWRGWRRVGVALAVLSLVGLWLVSTPWAAWRLADSLERRYPLMTVQGTPQADAALVLGGALAAAQLPLRPHINLGSAADRVWHAGALYRAGKVRWLLLSGGNQPGYEHLPAESEAMRELLRVIQVPDSAMRLEGLSRNTRENARYSLAMARALGARKLLLVTSALHMPRAMATFEAAYRGSGIELVAAATDAEALGDKPDSLWQWWPDAGSLAWSSRALKEYLGLLHMWIMRELR